MGSIGFHGVVFLLETLPYFSGLSFTYMHVDSDLVDRIWHEVECGNKIPWGDLLSTGFIHSTSKRRLLDY